MSRDAHAAHTCRTTVRSSSGEGNEALPGPQGGRQLERAVGMTHELARTRRRPLLLAGVERDQMRAAAMGDDPLGRLDGLDGAVERGAQPDEIAVEVQQRPGVLALG